MKKILTIVIASVTLGIVSQADNVEFRYTMKVKDSVLTDSMMVFGRAEEATDGIDRDYDFPSIPNIESASANPLDVPMPGPVQDIFFRAQVSIAGEGESVDNAYAKLYRDIRAASKKSTTWTVCTYSNDVELSWEGKYYDENTKVTINSALAEGNGDLKLCDSDNKVLVADMRTTTSYTLKANSVYNIKYIASGATEAPETPEEITDEFVIKEGASSVFDILDVSKYTLVDWTLCFYYVDGTDDAGPILKKFPKKDISSTGEANPNATYDPETGKFTYIYTDDFDHELAEMRLLYTYKYASGTRADDDEEGVATGMLRSVVADVIIKIDEDSKENEINVKGEASEKTVTIKYTVTTGEKLNLYGDFTLPPWSYKEGKCTEDPWVAVFKVNGTVVDPAATVASAENGGSTTIQFTAEKPLIKVENAQDAQTDYIVTIELTGNASCKSGSVVFTPKYVTFDDTEKTGDTLTANVKVKGMANLDIDGSANGKKYDITDVLILYNYITGGSGTPTEKRDTTMLKKTSYKTLEGEARAAKAAEFRAKIVDMIESLDLDNSSNGAKYDLTDVLILYNYITGGSGTPTEMRDTTMLKKTSYKILEGEARAAKAAEFREKIANMLDN